MSSVPVSQSYFSETFKDKKKSLRFYDNVSVLWGFFLLVLRKGLESPVLYCVNSQSNQRNFILMNLCLTETY
jgi:hypothetical protein